MKKPSKPAYGFTECSTISCPRLPNERGSLSILKSQMYQDKRGHYWCDLCTRRGELMDWAEANHWPSARVQGQMRYAILGNAEDWNTSLLTGSQDMVEALYETLIQDKRAPLDPDTSKEVKQFNNWLEKQLENIDE